MNNKLESLINEIVKIVDEEIFNDYFNYKTAIVTEQEVENERDLLRDLLEPYVDDSDFLVALKRAGIEDTEEYEEAAKLYGKPLYE